MKKDNSRNISRKNILVAGGAGYIGSHMTRMLLDEGFNPIVFDNLSTGYRELVPKGVTFIKGDLRVEKDIQSVFKKISIDAVMHFAASALVSESMSNPIKYYDNNVTACVNLLKAMLVRRVRKFIFSSTCAVYGEPERIPIREDNETKPTNPYGRSKLMMERILKDTADTYNFSYISLRYFNVAGAHPDGETGERHDPETHLVPNILKAAKGAKDKLTIFGDNYPTPDGTCIRDYIHVEDLCRAHLLALKALRQGAKSDIFNLGSGDGYSVKEVVKAAEEVVGKSIKTKINPRRPGDPAKLVASYTKAKKVLGWAPKTNLEEMISSAWKWERLNS